MTEVVLITGSETLLGRKLIEKHLALGRSVVAPIAGKGTARSETGNEKLTVLSWNRASWFSAKAIVREAMRIHGRIDQAYVLHQEPQGVRPFAESDASEAEEVLENDVKGAYALTRELWPLLERHEGSAIFAVPHRPGSHRGSLEALAVGAFKGWTGALLERPGSAVWACGFQTESTDTESFCEKILQETSARTEKLRGRWLLYTERRRLLSGSSIFDVRI